MGGATSRRGRLLRGFGARILPPPMKLVSFLLAGLVAAPSSVTLAQRPERGRDLGIPFEGTPGPLDAITDVGGVEVGHRTLVEGNGKLVVGKGPVRTGVTAIFPRGKDSDDPVFAGWFTMNGNGEMTRTTWVEESGFLWGAVISPVPFIVNQPANNIGRAHV